MKMAFDEKTYNKKYYQKNKARCKANAERYHQEHREEVAARRRIYSRENKEQLSAYHKKWRKKSKKQLNEYHKEWCKNNPEKKKAIDKRHLEKKILKEIAKAGESNNIFPLPKGRGIYP